MSLPLVNSVEALVESSWRERRGERSEPERDRQLDSTAPNGSQPAAVITDPQVMPKVAKAKRRRFTARDKQRILAAADQAKEPGEIGHLLRREGLYHSQLSRWRKEREAGLSAGLAGKARGIKGPSTKSLQQENRKLQRQNARLQEQLRKAEIIIEFQKNPRPCSRVRRRPRRVNGVDQITLYGSGP